ncbi:Sec-independent protein translocase protein [Escherichia coli]|uniref:Sec-independent protein translocase protein n=1 Tax=Escherichia coli TaxID=562 RepID=A0A376MM92_ECOLX|nr:Sec-independent protein translocase protein [Escherichia coli]
MSVEDTQPLITHLIELRKRLLNCIIAVIVIFLCLVYFANDIYHLVSAPLIKQLPQGSTMIATDVASPFFTPIKLTFMVSLILSAPVILYQVWAFIAPALYKHERRLVVPAAGFQLSVVLYRHGVRLLCGLPAGIWLPCQYRAGRGTGIHRHRQLFKLRYGVVYGVWCLL